MTPAARVDHLVLAAATLDEGVAWCRERLGAETAGGGEHPLMGTHNRVLRIDSPGYERVYLEIMAVDPAAPEPGRTRWFDLDDAALRATLAQGPRLIHFVAATQDVDAAVAALAHEGIDRGPPIAASRGALQWRITVRPDGRRLFDGLLPTLIQWGVAHPCDSLPASGLALQSLHATHPDAPRLAAAFRVIGLAQVPVETGAANLVATLATPKGPVRLESLGA